MSVSRFFTDYAAAYNRADPDAIAAMYHLPAVLMAEDAKTVYSQIDDIRRYFVNMIAKLQQAGVSRYQADVQQTMKLSDSICFCNVRWQFFAADGSRLFSCYVSYTLQHPTDERMEIVISVLDDEEKALAKVLEAS